MTSASFYCHQSNKPMISPRRGQNQIKRMMMKQIVNLVASKITSMKMMKTT
ncbi:hypothetical protein Hanom_Chr13g01201401 [Helianthus anomalus]